MVSNFLRRLPLSRLLLLCATVVAVGIGATALAGALGTGPVPPPKPLAQAVHDALTAPAVDGVSARIQLTDHLLEGANLASQGNGGGGGGGAASSPLLTGADGRLWISADGHVRLELQSEEGDTQILYDGHTVTLYDAASNNLYRYTPPQDSGAGGASDDSSPGTQPKIPTVAQIQEAIVHIMRHANLSGATSTDVAGQPAYAVRISPSRNGGLVGGAELAWDAVHGLPLRLAVYSTASSAPVLELTATEVSYGAVPSSVFQFTPPASAKVTEIAETGSDAARAGGPGGTAVSPQHQVTHEHGLTAVQEALPFTLNAPATLAGMTRGEVRGAEVNGHASGAARLRRRSRRDRRAGAHRRAKRRSRRGTVLRRSRRTARRAAAGRTPRRQRNGATDPARHAAELSARRHRISARRLGHPHHPPGRREGPLT